MGTGNSSVSLHDVLQEMLRLDLQKREELIARGELFQGYHPEMEEVHTSNGKHLLSYVQQNGFPYSTVTNEATEDAAMMITFHAISLPVLQHTVLSTLKKDGYKKQWVAMLEDRTLVFSGKRQRFGTQFDWHKTGELRPLPIEDMENVESRRREYSLPPLDVSLAHKRKRADEEGETPPQDIERKTAGQWEWMFRVGWIKRLADIDGSLIDFYV